MRGIEDPLRCRGRPCKKRKLVSLRFHFCFPANPFESKLARNCRKTKRAKPKLRSFCGERGIRTPGTGNPVRQFSKLVVSATHPPLRAKSWASLKSEKRGCKDIYKYCIAKIIYENIFHNSILVVFFQKSAH